MVNIDLHLSYYVPLRVMKERQKKWTREQLTDAVNTSGSIRQVIQKIGLVPAGGNYVQVQQYLKRYEIDTSHFHGMGWRKGNTTPATPPQPLKKILTKNSSYQSYKLKSRLWAEALKPKECEMCGWKEISSDGRLPLELDHINGDRYDNRLENLRVLCPNCHSLQPTHRGKNKRRG